MRALRAAAAAFAMAMIFTVAAFAADVFIDGEKVIYDENTTGCPITRDGVVLVPLYPTLEAFGADRIISDNPNGTVVITKGNVSVSCNTTDKEFVRNGTKIKADAGLVWTGGPLYVSTEIFSVFDADVYINGSGVIITRDAESTDKAAIYCSSGDESYRGSVRFGEKYEPQNGLYLGCFSNGDPISGISSFQSTYGKKAAAFTIKADIGKPFEAYSKELMFAVTEGKLVRLELYGTDLADPDAEKLSRAAEILGSCGARILLCPAPELTCVHSESYISDTGIYKDGFAKISDIFRSKAPSVAIVWQICSCNAENAQSYYPGDVYTHYAEYDSCKNEPYIPEKLSGFTCAYGYKKPLILKADISAPFFTDAPDKCLDLCTYLPVSFPSIKAVFLPDLAEYESLPESYVNILRSGVSGISYLEDQNPPKGGVPYYFELANGAEAPASTVRLYSKSSSDTDIACVVYKLNGEPITEAPIRNYPFEARLDLSKYAGETVSLETVMYDSSNRPCSAKTCMITVGTRVFPEETESPVKTNPIALTALLLTGIVGIFVILKKINDIFL